MVGVYLLLSKPKNNGAVGQQGKTSDGSIVFVDDQKMITFNYPAGAKKVQANSSTPIGGVSFFASYNNKEADGTWTISIVAGPKDETDNLATVKAGLIKYYKRIEDTKLGGENAVLYFYDNNTGKTVEAIHGDWFYSVGFGGGGRSTIDDSQMENASRLILNSFKFLK